MSNNYYTVITGAKDNAGDFLIKKRATQLLSKLRPDRDIVHFNSWDLLENEKLIIVNNSKAVLLAGGPSVQTTMYPEIYKLSSSIDKIKVPVICFGVGSKHHNFNEFGWKNYLLSQESLQLLDKINKSGYLSSVRDDFTHNILKHKGFKNFINTGCPALFENEDQQPSNVKNIKTILFSLGVSYKFSKLMFSQMKEVISFLNEHYSIRIALHHSIDKSDVRLFEILNWLNHKEIEIIDLSKGIDRFMHEYNCCDLHIGYRVHAHIYRLSISKPSILLAEDSRGVGVNETIPSNVINAYNSVSFNLKNRIKIKFSKNKDLFVPNVELIKTIDRVLNNRDLLFDSKRVKESINNRLEIMNSFTNQLP